MFGFEVDGNFVLSIIFGMVVQGSIEKCIGCVLLGVFFWLVCLHVVPRMGCWVSPSICLIHVWNVRRKAWLHIQQTKCSNSILAIVSS